MIKESFSDDKKKQRQIERFLKLHEKLLVDYVLYFNFYIRTLNNEKKSHKNMR